MTNEEIKKEVLHRVAVQKKKRQRVLRVSASLGAVVLVSLAGVGLMGSGVFNQTPPVIPADTVTTTTGSAADTTTTTVGTAGSTDATGSTSAIGSTSATTDGGIVTPPTTVTTPSKPTGTQAPTTGKTDPPKSTTGTKGSVTAYIPPIPTTTQPTTSAGSDRLLITGDEPDNTIGDQGSYSKNEIYISPTLREKMNQYKGVNALYAVHVAIPATREDQEEDFWTSTEELAQLNKEYYEAYFAYDEEATRLNPSWDRLNASEIEVWTDTMRANYESYLVLGKKRNDLKKQCMPLYVKSVLAQRLEALTALCEKEPIYIASNTISVFRHAYYVELTAEQINTLAAQGGYVFRLASEPEDIIVDM